MKNLYLAILIGLLGCHANSPSLESWHIQNDTICFSDPAGVLSWKRCTDLSGDPKNNCQTRVLLDRYGQPFEITPVEVLFHTENGVSKVKILGGSQQDEEFYCPTARVRK